MIHRTTLLTVLPVSLLMAAPVLGGSKKLTILGPNYPRVFYFRATEGGMQPETIPDV